jgi:8-oxo-dGTP diphosphatase
MTKIIDVAAAVIQRPDGSFVLGQRAPNTFYPGYWEFPGGKVETGETPRAALERELREELGIEVVRAHPWIVRQHIYEHAHVRLHFFRVLEWRGELCDHIHSALSWQKADAVTVTPMLPANGPVLRALTLPPVYGITRAAAVGVDAQIAQVERAIAQGLRLIQVREPDMPAAARERFARRVVALARRAGAKVLISGDGDLARKVGADGVHLKSRQLMQTGRRPALELAGASCHSALEMARAAELELDFVLLGPIKATPSHPDAQAMGWDAFAEMVPGYPLPVFAIGGMASSDLEAAWANGAHGIAAIRGAWSD